MLRRLIPPVLALLAACASGRNGPQAPTDDVEVWKQRAEKDPDGFGPQLYVAYDAIGRKSWEEVDRLAAPLAAQAKDEPALRAPLGALYLAAARSSPARWRTSWLESARGLLGRASQDRPESAEIHFNLGAASFLAKDFAAAVKATQAGLERAPGDPAGLRLLILSLIQQGEPASALGWVEQGHAALTPLERAEYAGLCRFMMGRNEESIRDYREAIRLRPDSARLWHNLALCYEENRELQQARECMAKADALRKAAEK
jgi:tetratricopeptide (TPR) repeat protein